MKKSSRLYGLGWILMVESIVVVFGLSTYGFFLAIRQNIIASFIHHHFDKITFSFIVLTIMFFIAGIKVYIEWRQRSSFIAIGVNHYEVEPSNRRDEFELDRSNPKLSLSSDLNRGYSYNYQ